MELPSVLRLVLLGRSLNYYIVALGSRQGKYKGTFLVLRQTDRWSVMLISVNLIDELEIAHAIHIDFIVKNDYDALRVHPHTLNFRVVVQLLNLFHILIIPKNHFVF